MLILYYKKLLINSIKFYHENYGLILNILYVILFVILSLSFLNNVHKFASYIENHEEIIMVEDLFSHVDIYLEYI